MPRPAKPWYRSGKNTWYATVGGRKISLGVQGRENKAEAVRAWHRLMAEEPKPEEKAPKTATVKQVIDGFLADAEPRVSTGCLRNYRIFLKPFSKKHGTRPAESLTATEVESFARKPDWSSTYRANFFASLVTAYRWAERERLIERSPLHGLRRPPKASRGRKALVSADDHKTLCQHADPSFRAFLQLLWLTGARPGEIAGLKAEELDLDQGVVVLTDHKTAHLGKSRVLFLSAEAVGVIRGLDRREGLLFPGEGGQKMTAQAIGRRLARLCQKAGVKACMAYGYRHSFATDALASGVPDAQVAALLGHSGTTMLHRHYSHLTARSQALRGALEAVRPGNGT
jgi:integrase